MTSILMMCVGIFIGKFFFKEKWKRSNELVQSICTALLIFAMGAELGHMDNFMKNILPLSIDSFYLFAFPTAGSIFFVYIITKLFLEDKENRR